MMLTALSSLFLSEVPKGPQSVWIYHIYLDSVDRRETSSGCVVAIGNYSSK